METLTVRQWRIINVLVSMETLKLDELKVGEARAQAQRRSGDDTATIETYTADLRAIMAIAKAQLPG